MMQTTKQLLALPTVPFSGDYGWWPALYLLSTDISTDHPDFRRVVVIGVALEDGAQHAMVGQAILSYAESVLLPVMVVREGSGESDLGFDSPRSGLIRLYTAQHELSIESALSDTRIIARRAVQ